jgi:hypothetical protein
MPFPVYKHTAPKMATGHFFVLSVNTPSFVLRLHSITLDVIIIIIIAMLICLLHSIFTKMCKHIQISGRGNNRHIKTYYVYLTYCHDLSSQLRDYVLCEACAEQAEV